MQGLRSAWMLLLLTPMCVAWTGSGSGSVDWSPGAQTHELAFDLMGTMDENGGIHAVATLGLPDGHDAVFSLLMGASALNAGGMDLPTAQMAVRYTEYNADGSLYFEAHRDPSGFASVKETRDGYEGQLVVLLADVVDPAQRRTLRRLSWRLTTVSAQQSEPAEHHDDVAVPVAAGGGCSDGWGDDDEGWVAEDSDDGWESSDSGGCDGDDDEWASDSGDSSSGCEGDDVSSASDSDVGCEGDAIAAGPNGRHRRSPWIMRLINWMPWLMVFGFVRLSRRRRKGAGQSVLV